MDARYQVTAVDPENHYRSQQRIVEASSKEHAKLVMRGLLRERQLDHYSITWVGEVPFTADQYGSTHGD